MYAQLLWYGPDSVPHLCDYAPFITAGILCGECKNGKGVSALLNYCVTCENASGILVIALGT